MVGPITAITPGNPTTSITVNVTTATGPVGPFNNWSVFPVLSPDQSRRGCRYGDQVDMIRPYQTKRFPAPIFAYVENGFPQGPLNSTLASGITPPEMNAAMWCAIIHGARGIVIFNVSIPGSFHPTADNLSDAFFRTIQSPNTISIYDQTKATNKLIKTLTPVIHSQFALGYVTVAGDNMGGGTPGFAAPYSAPFIPANFNDTGPYPHIGSACPNLNFNRSLASAFEVMAKYYTGTTSNTFLTPNKYYIFADYRGSASDTNIVATFTIANTGSTSVTRIYSDGVIGAVASGRNTSITVGNSSQASPGDTIIIEGAPEWLNGTYTISAVPDATHIIVPVSGGALRTSFGTCYVLHNIPVAGGGRTFTDTFVSGRDIRIYRVN
jgi:hypothetical protein